MGEFERKNSKHAIVHSYQIRSPCHEPRTNRKVPNRDTFAFRSVVGSRFGTELESTQIEDEIGSNVVGFDIGNVPIDGPHQ